VDLGLYAVAAWKERGLVDPIGSDGIDRLVSWLLRVTSIPCSLC